MQGPPDKRTLAPLVILLLVGITTACAAVESETPSGRTRTYYIAADEVLWDYAPSGTDQIAGAPFDEVANMWVVTGDERIGRKYKKSLYREYTDATFETLKARSPQWEHLGFLGPLLRAEVGDTFRAVFKNNTRYPASLHPHGVFYKKNSEGAVYADGTKDADRADGAIRPGGTYTYEWPVPERAGPGAGEPSSAFWMYHSHVHEVEDVNAGLIGPMIVTVRGQARPDGSPLDVDRELVVAFAEVDENVSWYLDDNIRSFAGKPGVVTKKYGWGPNRQVQGPCNVFEPFCSSNVKDSLNGYLYGNLPMLNVMVGERVRWYLMSSTNFEIHAPHWHGNTVHAQHMRTDVASLLPMGMLVADMVPDNPGTWLFHCHVGPHLMAGMQARYTVEPQHLTGR